MPPKKHNDKFKLGLAKAREAELLAALNKALLCIKRTYQAGYDRIIESGGTCDTPEYMLEHDPTVREIQALIHKHK